MASSSKPRTHRIAFALLALFTAWIAPARADEVLDRSVRFDIPAAPLASALIEFSTQSGIQVAVADKDVAHLQSKAVAGEYPIHQVLDMLLHGTSLEYSRIGASTVAIRSAASGPAEPQAQFPDVAAISAAAPSDQQLTADGLYQFIVHHATTPYPSSEAVVGSLLRWRGGRPETICPLTLGLDAAYNAFVAARLRALAAYVGAPVQADPHCNDNVRFAFTTEPEKLMGEVLKRAAGKLGVKFPHQMQKQLAFSSTHAVQGYYLTAAGGGRILNADATLLGHVELLPVWPLVVQTGLRGAGCCNGGIVSAIFVIDTTKVAGYTIGSIADYVSLLALSVVELPDHCDPLPSILDLMAPSCASRERPTGITAGDLAFLKALYFHNTGLGPSLSRDEIQLNMMRQFKGR